MCTPTPRAPTLSFLSQSHYGIPSLDIFYSLTKLLGAVTAICSHLPSSLRLDFEVPLVLHPTLHSADFAEYPSRTYSKTEVLWVRINYILQTQWNVLYNVLKKSRVIEITPEITDIDTDRLVYIVDWMAAVCKLWLTCMWWVSFIHINSYLVYRVVVNIVNTTLRFKWLLSHLQF